jgi:hypothetical protein
LNEAGFTWWGRFHWWIWTHKLYWWFRTNKFNSEIKFPSAHRSIIPYSGACDFIDPAHVRDSHRYEIDWVGICKTTLTWHPLDVPLWINGGYDHDGKSLLTWWVWEVSESKLIDKRQRHGSGSGSANKKKSNYMKGDGLQMMKLVSLMDLKPSIWVWTNKHMDR